MSVPLRTGNQEVTSKHCCTDKHVQLDSLHSSLYKTKRKWLNVLTRLYTSTHVLRPAYYICDVQTWVCGCDVETKIHFSHWMGKASYRPKQHGKDRQTSR
jgi:hypothetical protein